MITCKCGSEDILIAEEIFDETDAGIEGSLSGEAGGLTGRGRFKFVDLFDITWDPGDEDDGGDGGEEEER